MTSLPDGEILLELGIDAAKWAQEFCLINPDIDEGVMISWFANAIEAGRSNGRKETCSHSDVWSYEDLRICNLCGMCL